MDNKTINSNPAETTETNEPLTLIDRIRETKTTRWIRFGIVSLIFLLWVCWLQSWWVLVFWFLLFDIYITGYIPLTWWKKSKNKTTRAIMSWVDAIVYALVLVYFVFTFVGQNYQIPSSSLEKTLLVGDYLWVNKMAYGPRVPMTPVHFPLVQNTLPIVNTRSYLEKPQWKYHRLKGYTSVKHGDIVVFNFPAGDTVCFKVQNPDYYTLLKIYGRDVINSHPEEFGEVMYRPVDRRENYVKRCVGLPGEKLKIVNGDIYINGVRQQRPEHVQFNYLLQTSRPLTDDELTTLGIAEDDRRMLRPDPSEAEAWSAAGFDTASAGPIYNMPLTDAMIEKLKADGLLVKIMKEPEVPGEYLFPDGISSNWTRSNYGEVWIPAKGSTIDITPENWPMYERVIRNYENHTDSYVKDGKVYIDGKEATTYTFEMDYYFMMGDNRDQSLDSRYWGFVPEDHIVGKPMRVLISFDKDSGLPRWNRIFKNANAGF